MCLHHFVGGQKHPCVLMSGRMILKPVAVLRTTATSQVAMRIKWAKSGARQCPGQSLVQSECPDVCDYGFI